MIDFQNTGTADALQVVLRDTLPPEVSLFSVSMGASSHPYSWEIQAGRCLQITFDNINLPPASQDSAGSIGFVKFTVNQVNGNATGTRIENFADIFFDLNPPIRTNTVFNTIGWLSPNAIGEVVSQVQVKVYPNPSRGEVFWEVEGLEEGAALRLEMYSIVGQRVLVHGFESGERLKVETGKCSRGVYLYRVLEGGKELKAGKLLLR